MTVHYDACVRVEHLEKVTCENCKEWIGIELLAGTIICGGRGDCQNLKTKEPHTCPYAEEINGDYETLCSCCDDCQGECCMDI